MKMYYHDSQSFTYMDTTKPLEEQLAKLAEYVGSLERRLLAVGHLIRAFKIYENVESNGDYEKKM